MKGLPLVSSKLLDKRWKSRDQEIHKQRLRQVKSQMRVIQSTPFMPMVRNTKKEELAERITLSFITLMQAGSLKSRRRIASCWSA